GPARRVQREHRVLRGEQDRSQLVEKRELRRRDLRANVFAQDAERQRLRRDRLLAPAMRLREEPHEQRLVELLAQPGRQLLPFDAQPERLLVQLVRAARLGLVEARDDERQLAARLMVAAMEEVELVVAAELHPRRRAAAQHDLDPVSGKPADEPVDAAQQIGRRAAVALELVDAVEHEKYPAVALARDGGEALELPVETRSRVDLEVQCELALDVERQRSAVIVEEHRIAGVDPLERPVAQQARLAGAGLTDDDQRLPLSAREARKLGFDRGTRNVARFEIGRRSRVLPAQLAKITVALRCGAALHVGPVAVRPSGAGADETRG